MVTAVEVEHPNWYRTKSRVIGFLGFLDGLFGDEPHDHFYVGSFPARTKFRVFLVDARVLLCEGSLSYSNP